MLEHDQSHHLHSAPASSAATATTPLDAGPSIYAQYSTLYHSGSAARWRRKQDDYFSYNGRSTTSSLSAIRQRSMEEVHGVDVSWLHHAGKSGRSARRCVRGRVTAGRRSIASAHTNNEQSTSDAIRRPRNPRRYRPPRDR